MSRLAVTIDSTPERTVYWDLPNEQVTAILLQNLVASLGPAHGELP